MKDIEINSNMFELKNLINKDIEAFRREIKKLVSKGWSSIEIIEALGLDEKNAVDKELIDYIYECLKKYETSKIADGASKKIEDRMKHSDKNQELKPDNK